jgi:hypothetical protein
VGIFDDFSAAYWRNQANSDRAAGRSGTLHDMLANRALGRSVAELAEESMRRANQAMVGDLAEVLAAERQEAEASHKAALHEDRLARHAEAKNRALLIQDIVDTLAALKLKARQWERQSPSPRELFGAWASLRGCKSRLIDNAIDDPALIRDVSTYGALVADYAASAGLGSFDTVLGDMRNLINALCACSVTCLMLQGNPANVISREDQFPGKSIVSPVLRSKYQDAIAILDELEKEKLPLLSKRLQMLGNGGTILAKNGGIVFSPEFALVDGPCTLDDGPTKDFLESFTQQHIFEFEHDNANSILNRTAETLLFPDGAETLVADRRRCVDDFFRRLTERKRYTLAQLISSKSPAKAFAKSLESDYIFSDIEMCWRQVGLLSGCRPSTLAVWSVMCFFVSVMSGWAIFRSVTIGPLGVIGWEPGSSFTVFLVLPASLIVGIGGLKARTEAETKLKRWYGELAEMQAHLNFQESIKDDLQKHVI